MAQRALLVGVNKYKIPGSDLNGCVNDVTNIRDILLKYFGFDVNDIRVLIDDSATKENIMNRLRWLVADIKSGDRLPKGINLEVLLDCCHSGTGTREACGNSLSNHGS